MTGSSARPAAQDAEEGLDVGVGAEVAVPVEVGGAVAGRSRAVACNAGEEGLDVGVGADVAVAVEVGRAAGAADPERPAGGAACDAVAAGKGALADECGARDFTVELRAPGRRRDRG